MTVSAPSLALYMGAGKTVPMSLFTENIDVLVSIFSAQQIEGQKWNILYIGNEVLEIFNKILHNTSSHWINKYWLETSKEKINK